MSARSPKAPADTGLRYPSLSSFYLADQRRVASREVDIGLWWREGDDGVLHRAAWIRDTGELYLVRLGPREAGGGAVELLAAGADEEQLERALDGWRETCGRADSLSWLRERAATLRERARGLQLRVVAATAAVIATTSLGAVAGTL